METENTEIIKLSAKALEDAIKEAKAIKEPVGEDLWTIFYKHVKIEWPRTIREKCQREYEEAIGREAFLAETERYIKRQREKNRTHMRKLRKRISKEASNEI